MKYGFAVAAIVVVITGLVSAPLYAAEKKPTAKSCKGGLVACVQRCVAAGGRQRYCPDWCTRERGC